MTNTIFLISLPIISFFLIAVSSTVIRNIVTLISVILLSYFSIDLFFSSKTIVSSFSHFFHMVFFVLDVILLLFFFVRGMIEKDNKVYILAALQLLLYAIFTFLKGSHEIVSDDILIDNVSLVMLSVINIVGGIIILYALKYIDSEEFSQLKKNLFISILFFFLAVMNLLVMTNSIEIFFLCFELTTLCSYLLIRYRGDTLSKANALRALWMNQIGGVVILIVLILSTTYYETSYFNILLASISSTHMFIIAIFTIAAFVKGASIPFDKWLLGAMVAPTPVSAILHSATMVKIAPYLILKLSIAFTPFISSIMVFVGMFIFMTASFMALSKDYFKEILGLSTIALLAFMMAIASIGNETATQIALVLIVFHAISKALLFLQAGILEKEFHLKYLSDINFLIDKSPLVVFLILIGFASLTLPPFGVFIGKFLSIELMIEQMKINPLYIVSFIFMILGSVLLTLLYFKVVTKLLSNQNYSQTSEVKTISSTYKYTSLSLFALLIFGILNSIEISSLSYMQIFIPLCFIFIVPIILYLLRSKNVNLVKEYNCGEKDEFVINAYYFDLDEQKITKIKYFCLFCMGFVVLGSVIW